jgi:hypothetical protein
MRAVSPFLSLSTLQYSLTFTLTHAWCILFVLIDSPRRRILLLPSYSTSSDIASSHISCTTFDDIIRIFRVAEFDVNCLNMPIVVARIRTSLSWKFIFLKIIISRSYGVRGNQLGLDLILIVYNICHRMSRLYVWLQQTMIIWKFFLE